MSGDFNIRGKNSDREFENALRPLSFPDFNGQEKIDQAFKNLFGSASAVFSGRKRQRTADDVFN